MRRTLLATALLLSFAWTAAQAQTAPTNGTLGVTVGQTPVMVFGPVTSAARHYLWLVNVATVGSGSIWCSDFDPAPAANKAGSYEIPPGTAYGREFMAMVAGYAPQGAITCVAPIGSLPLTAESN